MPRSVNPVPRFLLLATLLLGCERIHYRAHEFSAAEVNLPSGITATVSVFGSWKTRRSGDSTIQERGSPYVVEVRLHGVRVSGYSVELQLIDTVANDTTPVTEWSTSTIDPADSARVLAFRDGVRLGDRSHGVRLLLQAQDARGSPAMVGEGILRHSLTRSARLRTLERIRGF
jgi:hypothetical protein